MASSHAFTAGHFATTSRSPPAYLANTPRKIRVRSPASKDPPLATRVIVIGTVQKQCALQFGPDADEELSFMKLENWQL